MNIRLLRHATLLLSIGDRTILVDPMLSHAGAMDPVRNAASEERIPLVDLPLSDEELQSMLLHLDGILVTHDHRDHFDQTAAEILPKHLPLFCPDVYRNEQEFQKCGFERVIPIQDSLQWQTIQFIRTGGQHGTGAIGRKMGSVSGFVIQTDGSPTLYIAGDSIWCAEVEQAILRYQPDIIVVNSGAARFLAGDPITMDINDVARVYSTAPQSTIVAVHFEAINHCILTREKLREALEQRGFLQQVRIPMDGEILTFS